MAVVPHIILSINFWRLLYISHYYVMTALEIGPTKWPGCISIKTSLVCFLSLYSFEYSILMSHWCFGFHEMRFLENTSALILTTLSQACGWVTIWGFINCFQIQSRVVIAITCAKNACLSMNPSRSLSAPLPQLLHDMFNLLFSVLQSSFQMYFRSQNLAALLNIIHTYYLIYY